jgi:hypothetical protein
VIRKGGDVPDEFWDASISRDLATGVTPILRGAFRDGGQEAISEFDLAIDWDLLEPKAGEYAAARGAEMIGMKIVDGKLVPNPNAEWVIEDTTREAVQSFLNDALREGWSYEEFASRIEESGLFSEGRAETIARTELAIAEAQGHVEAYREEGVEEVVIYDEDGCDLPVCDVDGQIWTLEEYEDEPLGHPNCTRAARPLTRDEREQRKAA